MSLFQDRFSIRDLEQFSGIKAHTLRIWERRYGFLAPERTGTNLRRYSIEELKLVLNVAYLSRQGMRISRIASASAEQRERWVQERADGHSGHDLSMDGLKLATLAYDTDAFQRTSSVFEARYGFEQLMEQLFLPFLEQLGLWWQTSSVCPAQEHFASNLIRKHVILATAAIAPQAQVQGDVVVLFLPENEVHELGLLYVQFLLCKAGTHVIYLGASVPMEDLLLLGSQFERPLTFVGISTCMPRAHDLSSYVASFSQHFGKVRTNVLLGGAGFREWNEEVPAGVRVFRSLSELRDVLCLPAARFTAAPFPGS